MVTRPIRAVNLVTVARGQKQAEPGPMRRSHVRRSPLVDRCSAERCLHNQAEGEDQYRLDNLSLCNVSHVSNVFHNLNSNCNFNCNCNDTLTNDTPIKNLSKLNVINCTTPDTPNINLNVNKDVLVKFAEINSCAETVTVNCKCNDTFNDTFTNDTLTKNLNLNVNKDVLVKFTEINSSGENFSENKVVSNSNSNITAVTQCSVSISNVISNEIGTNLCKICNKDVEIKCKNYIENYIDNNVYTNRINENSIAIEYITSDLDKTLPYGYDNIEENINNDVDIINTDIKNTIDIYNVNNSKSDVIEKTCNTTTNATINRCADKNVCHNTSVRVPNMLNNMLNNIDDINLLNNIELQSIKVVKCDTNVKIDNKFNRINTFIDHSYSNDNNVKIKFLSLNVCGLLSKLKFPEFEELLTQHDIIILTETKLSQYKTCDLPGYKLFTLNRKYYTNCSGGIALLVKNKIEKYIQIKNGMSECVLWFCLDKKLLGFELFLGAVYIPPQYSKYASENVFELIENDLIMLNLNDSPVCFLGDFNSRTGCKTDFVPYDEQLFEDAINNNLIFRNIKDHLFNHENLLALGYDTCRFSQDKVINPYGRELLNLCKTIDVHIVNGRLHDDRKIGKFTCKDKSVVDYVLCSSELFPHVFDFKVEEYCELFSDVHNPITFSLQSKNEVHNTSVINNTRNTHTDIGNYNILVKKPKWNNTIENVFVNNLDINLLNDIEVELENMSCNNPSESDINCITKCIKNVFTECAEKAGSIKQDVQTLKTKSTENKKYNKKVNKKPWFNDSCRMKRNNYFTAKRLYNKCKSSENNVLVKNNCKLYKKEVKKQHRIYYKQLNKKIKCLKSTNSKEYWSILTGKSKDSAIEKVKLECFFDHFKKLNTASVPESNSENSTNDCNPDNMYLNNDFTVEEIIVAINNLKTNKACGMDQLINEFFKCSSYRIAPILCKLFNVVLNTGIIPDDWCVGIINPIFKGKGENSDPNNYRGISLLSCFGKLFTSCINKRLNEYADSHNILGEEQAGFRPGYSTADHIFSLKCIIDIYLSSNKKLFCAFVDYEKAFDKVNRVFLWQKLLKNNINGKIFNVIVNMYNKTKACVKNGKYISDFFHCYIGVKQGDNLSPFLFAIFLNDFSEFISKSYNGLAHLSNLIDQHCSTDDINVYLRLYVLLYADDTIILAESESELQSALNGLYLYCSTWSLSVNTAKTKIVIFSKRKFNCKKVFKYNENCIDVVDNYIYLGINFYRTGNVNYSIVRQCEQAKKVMFSILKKSYQLHLDLDTMIHLFNAVICPVLTYGAEVWGFNNNSLQLIDRIQMKFFKILLKVNKSTPNCMLYGELGILPSTLIVKQKLLCFWARIVNSKKEKISKQLYVLLYDSFNNNHNLSRWIESIKSYLDGMGLSFYWLLKDINVKQFKQSIKLRMSDMYRQEWSENIFKSNKCIMYRIIKNEPVFEEYLLNNSIKNRIIMCKFRLGNHKLPIVKGRFLNIAKEERVCNLCNLNLIGDEFHYLFMCSHFNNERTQYLKKYFYMRPNTFKMYQLFNTKKYFTCLCKFIDIIVKGFT